MEKVYTEVIEDLHSKAGQTIFYVDIGSSHADLISECNKGRNLILILDHHDPKPSRDPKVLDLNLEHYDFKGETDFSGATCCYLFAKVNGCTLIDTINSFASALFFVWHSLVVQE